MSIDEEMRRISLAANIECNRQMREGAGMSEVFDPEKVPTFQSAPFEGCFAEGGQGGCEDKGVIHVRKSDYDKLLALYRELRDRPYSTWPQGG